MILIAKLIANFLHSITPTAVSGLGSLWFGGIFDHAEAVYLVEIYTTDCSSQQLQKRRLEVTKLCNVTLG